MCLSHDKALQIDEYSRKQAVRLMRSTNNQEFESVKCQCGWDGEETTMVRLFYEIEARQLIVARLLAISATRASTYFAMASKAWTTLEFQIHMSATNACWSRTK